MLGLIATAGGFEGDYGADAPTLTLAPDAAPRLAALALLLVLLVAWVWLRLHTLER